MFFGSLAVSAYTNNLSTPSTSLEESNRKAEKSSNTNGAPIKLLSKILAVAADPLSKESVYVAESAGTVRRVVLEVGEEELKLV